MTVDVRRAVLTYLGSGADSRFSHRYLIANVSKEAHCPQTAVWEALWGLVGDGLAYLDTDAQGSSTDNWCWRLSADGLRIAKGGTWEPRDPDGYIVRIHREIPNLDGLVELYLARPRANYFALWTEFRKRIEPARKELPDGLADALTLDAIADLIRLTRNEVGHPTGRQIDEDTARVHLAIAPTYLRKMSQLSAHFEGLPAGASS